jgi:hypothetical protein
VEEAKLKDFNPRLGALVSGDYVSATDNLPIEVAEDILSVCLENAPYVPAHIKNIALRAMRPSLFADSMIEDTFTPVRGQMMGSYLSFPLLCIQNYLAFQWALHKDGMGLRERLSVPVKINGDDILFQEVTPGLAGRWVSAVGSVGLQVEETKTSVSTCFGTLNSTLLKWRKEALTVVHTFRFGMLRKVDYPNCLGKSFEKFVGKSYGNKTVNTRAWNAAKVFIEAHKRQLSGISLDKFGFRGRLAFRLAKLYNLLPQSLQERDLPQPPPVHNVIVPPDLTVDVPEIWIRPGLAAANADLTREWRWGVHVKETDRKALRKKYQSVLHGLRDLRRVPLSSTLSKKMFKTREPLRVRKVWKSLLDSNLPRYDPLDWLVDEPPAYSDVVFDQWTPWWSRTEKKREEGVSPIPALPVGRPDVVW